MKTHLLLLTEPPAPRRRTRTAASHFDSVFMGLLMLATVLGVFWLMDAASAQAAGRTSATTLALQQAAQNLPEMIADSTKLLFWTIGSLMSWTLIFAFVAALRMVDRQVTRSRRPLHLGERLHPRPAKRSQRFLAGSAESQYLLSPLRN